MTTTISSLLSRVRAASGPDSDLDVDIGIALAGWRRGRATLDPFSFTAFRIADGGIAFTSSIDDAVALVERTGYVIHTIHRSKSGLWSVTLEPIGESEDLRLLPLAILAALLSALEQKESV